MATVGQGVTHPSQVSELDAEIEALTAEFTGAGQQQQTEQQPPSDPGQVAPADGDGMVEAITSVDEFIQSEEAGATPAKEEAADQEQVAALPPEVPPLVDDEQVPGQGEVAPQPQAGGRRSWKTDFLELENRYVLLRQASDTFKFETKQQLASLQEMLLKTQEENEQFRNAMAAQQSASQKQSVADAFSQSDIDVLGEGTINSFQTAINTAVESATKPLQSELLNMKKAERDRLRGDAQTNRNQAYQTFEQRLAQIVPDYPTINVNPEFVKWLKSPSPFSGTPRMGFFHQAEQSGDVERVAQFFVEFENMLKAPQQLLEQSITPSGQGGGGAPPQTNLPPAPGKKVFSMAFINKFYDDDIAGKYQGKEALRDKIDKEIDAALQDGRVV